MKHPVDVPPPKTTKARQNDNRQRKESEQKKVERADEPRPFVSRLQVTARQVTHPKKIPNGRRKRGTDITEVLLHVHLFVCRSERAASLTLTIILSH